MAQLAVWAGLFEGSEAFPIALAERKTAATFGATVVRVGAGWCASGGTRGLWEVCCTYDIPYGSTSFNVHRYAISPAPSVTLRYRSCTAMYRQTSLSAQGFTCKC